VPDDATPPEFLTDLAANRSAIALASMHLEKLSVAGVDALAQFVPLTTSLVNLQVDVLAGGAACRRGLAHSQAIYQNGSLQTMTIECTSTLYGSLLSKVLQRNTQWPTLLSQTMDDNDNSENEQDQDSVKVEPAENDQGAASHAPNRKKYPGCTASFPHTALFGAKSGTNGAQECAHGLDIGCRTYWTVSTSCSSSPKRQVTR
jgi:hypothetical protein